MLSKLQHVLDKQSADELLTEVETEIAEIEVLPSGKKQTIRTVEVHAVMQYLRINRRGEYDSARLGKAGERLLRLLKSDELDR